MRKSGNIVSSLDMIKSSIVTDNQVFQWFDMLVTCTDVRTFLNSRGEFDKVYWQLYKNSVGTFILFGLLIVLILFGLYRGHILFWVVPLIVFGGILKLKHHRKSYIIKIAGELIEGQVQEYHYKTLYQICEILSRRYHLPSLTDSLSWTDNIERRFLIGTVFFVFFIVPFSLKWAICILFFSNILAHTIILRSSLILRFIK